MKGDEKTEVQDTWSFTSMGLVVFYCSMIALSGKPKWDRATNPLLEMPGGEGWLVGPKQ